MEFSKPRIRPVAARPKPNAACKKHPRHRQSPGVCSLCLNEKLSKLTSIHGRGFPKPRGGKAPSSCSSSSSYVSSLSSSNASSYSSPVVGYGKSSTRVFKNGSVGRDVYEKSRSMAFVWQRRKGEETQVARKGVERKRGFWSRFLSARVITAVH